MGAGLGRVVLQTACRSCLNLPPRAMYRESAPASLRAVVFIFVYFRYKAEINMEKGCTFVVHSYRVAAYH